jgi:hypothetical protein
MSANLIYFTQFQKTTLDANPDYGQNPRIN